MSYIIVHAQFPETTNEERNEIYKNLDSKGWKKIHTIGIDVSTIWQLFSASPLTSVLMNNAQSDFNECSKKYTKPKLVVHVGPGPAIVI
jgi:hypothetical protein